MFWVNLMCFWCFVCLVHANIDQSSNHRLKVQNTTNSDGQLNTTVNKEHNTTINKGHNITVNESGNISVNDKINDSTPDNSITKVCGVNIEFASFVVNGTKTTIGEFPWLVAMFYYSKGDYDYRCAGTLVTNRHIITAAHCFRNKAGIAIVTKNVLFVLGKPNIDNWISESEVRGVEKLLIHPSYNKSSDADLAVVKMDATVSFSNTINPICLWSYSDILETIVGNEGVVAGWGRDETGADQVSEAKKISMPIISQDDCLRSDVRFFMATSNRTFCAGYRNGSIPCTGDSGSAFIMKRNKKWWLRGVVSTGLVTGVTRDCDSSKYVVFADVAKFKPWLITNLEGTEDSLFSKDTVENVFESLTDICNEDFDDDKIEFPWLVVVLFAYKANYKFNCAGTLITRLHVLSVAHCFRTEEKVLPKDDILLSMGHNNLKDWARKSILRGVTHLTMHPYYRSESGDYNIALLKMNEPVAFSGTLRPLCLWDEPDELNRVVGKIGVVAGWKSDSKGDRDSIVPRKISIPIVSQEKCLSSHQAFKSMTSARTFCAGNRSGEIPCKGESGGAYFIKSGSKWKLRGILSRGVLELSTYNCDESQFIVFTDVSKYKDWIHDNLK